MKKTEKPQIVGIEEISMDIASMQAIKSLSQDYSHLAEDYIVSHITSKSPHLSGDIVRRFDGMTIIILVKGHIKLTVNLEEVHIKPCSIAFITPDTYFSPGIVSGQEVEAYLLFMSNKFIRDVNIDLNAINSNLFTTRKTVLRLRPERVQLLTKYFDLLHITANEENSYTRLTARALVTAAGYQVMAFGEEAAQKDILGQPRSRRTTYVRTFLTLVRNHYRKERAIGFYADKMFISPKYLSMIIKEATGKSAAEWIDQYVIQEAKNLLRYSGKNVQQIAYELNFTNQSSFGKYFKHLVGMSPTRFQNT